MQRFVRTSRAGLQQLHFQHAVHETRLNRNLRRPGPAVPTLELRELHPTGFAHRVHKILDRHRLPIEALEIQVTTASKTLRAEQRVNHANQLGALLIHCRRVEIGDLEIAVRPDRMRERPGVFRKLHIAQKVHRLNPSQRARIHIRRKLVVAKHGKAFLQAQLKPVAAGHAIAGPVVKVLVRNHRLHPRIGRVGCRVGRSQDDGCIEDVEPLVFHGPEVEVLNRDDHEAVEVVFPPIDLLIPAHGALERLHGKATLGNVILFRIYAQFDAPATASNELVPEHREPPGHQREQVTRLGEGIFPNPGAPSISPKRLGDAVSVRQGHGIVPLVCRNPRGHLHQHIWPIRRVGNATKPLRLALRAEHLARGIEAHEPRVGRGTNPRHNLKLERIRHIEHLKLRGRNLILVVRKRIAIQLHRNQLELVALQHERLGITCPPLEAHARRDLGHLGVKIEVKPSLWQGKVRRRVVLAPSKLKSSGHVHEAFAFGAMIEALIRPVRNPPQCAALAT